MKLIMLFILIINYSILLFSYDDVMCFNPNRPFPDRMDVVRFASMDLDGNSFTPFEGEIITNTRGSKRFVSAHEMEYGQIMFIWTDYCVSNCVYDPDYNAIAGQLYDFSALSNDNYTVPSTHLFCMSNYPNPFNPTTTINYSLKENVKVLLNIYNIKGQLVKVLFNDFQNAGEHSAIWNGDDESGKSVSSGIYFYKLKAGKDFSHTKRMLLLK